MPVWTQLSAPVHSMVKWGWAPSISSTLLASCFGPSSLFTSSWKSAPKSLAMARRSGNRSAHGKEKNMLRGQNTKRIEQKTGVIASLHGFSWERSWETRGLPVMSTCEAPIALATSKHTNPIGPAERLGRGISTVSAAEVHSTHDRKLVLKCEKSHSESWAITWRAHQATGPHLIWWNDH